MHYVLIDDHGTPLGEFEDRRTALEALAELAASDPRAADECGVIAFDEQGNRVGKPISGPAAA